MLRVDDLDTLSTLLLRVKECGAQVRSVWPKRKTLEDLFLREIRSNRNGGEDR